MTFKDVQTALKAIGIKKTIQEISDFFAQQNLSLETVSLDLVVELFVKAQNQPKEKQKTQNFKENFAKSHSLTLLGEFYALKSEEYFYVVFLSKPLMAKLYRCESLPQAELIADWLNNVSKQ